MLAIRVGGRKITAATEKILITLFCSRLVTPMEASSWKLILSNRNWVWGKRDSTSCSISSIHLFCSPVMRWRRLRLRKRRARRVSCRERRIWPLASSWAISSLSMELI
ncbi:hypothetical protein D3C79_778310 [compost metagenome]